eukprot:TRINITY_DN9314_c0_g4_i3.p1 TRINITY_DN9314_c0_g4~~TRINITY_DN9314_c0_g4_i3.p1  ORF type:complete len:283 (-),score=32.29 TRINITY_DN9314_c0_g4_i3:142-990(-)
MGSRRHRRRNRHRRHSSSSASPSRSSYSGSYSSSSYSSSPSRSRGRSSEKRTKIDSEKKLANAPMLEQGKEEEKGGKREAGKENEQAQMEDSKDKRKESSRKRSRSRSRSRSRRRRSDSRNRRHRRRSYSRDRDYRSRRTHHRDKDRDKKPKGISLNLRRGKVGGSGGEEGGEENKGPRGKVPQPSQPPAVSNPVTPRGWIDDDLTQNSEILKRRPHHPRNLERDEKRLKSIAVKEDKPGEDEKNVKGRRREGSGEKVPAKKRWKHDLYEKITDSPDARKSK